jgi:hypothetical protein
MAVLRFFLAAFAKPTYFVSRLSELLILSPFQQQVKCSAKSGLLGYHHLVSIWNER